MKITKIVAVLARGTKDFTFHTDIPSGIFPYQDHNAYFKMQISCDWEKYLAEHFPNIPVEVVDVRK